MSDSNTPSLVAAGLDLRRLDAPDALAIVTPEESITYGELHERVSQLATTIVERCAPSTWLPVLVDRSIDSSIAFQAVARAGRAFVPVESSLPPARIAELLELSGRPTSAVVSRPEMAAVLPAGVTAIAPGARHHDVADPVPVAAGDPAWMCFTSGSTGTPKGVYGSWEHIDRTVMHFGIDVPDVDTRLSHIWPMGFLAGIFWAWRLSGGTRLCMIDPSTRSIEDLVAWFAEQEITIGNFGGALSASISNLDGRRLPTVREYSLGQSGADWTYVERIRKLCSPDVVVVNNWDASEAGYGFRYRIGPDHPVLSGPLPISRLGYDDRLRLEPCESGTEILFRDPCSIGYYDMPELTDDRYFVDDEGTRWWHSRDLATVDDDGYVLFAGRVDLMVKINGIRVEPAEAEYALRSTPGVAAAAVIAHPVGDGNVRLVGHLCIDDPALTPESLRSHLALRLPEHLIPSVFMVHDSLPSTDRGKIDRAALRATRIERWRTNRLIRSGHPIAIWLRFEFEKVIGLGEVGTRDDLWESGLDSMGAVEICSVIAANGLGEIDPTTLLRHRTIEQLAGLFEMGEPMSDSPAVVLNPEGRRPPLFVVPGNGGTSLAFRSLATAVGDDQPLVIVEPRGMHSIGRIERTVDERIETLLGEIESRLEPGEPVVLIGYSLGGTIAFGAASILRENARPVHLVLLDGTLGGRDFPLGGNPNYFMKRSRTRISRLRRFLRKWYTRTTLPIKERVMPLRRSRPRYDKVHYDVFMTVGVDAVKKYDLKPAPIPTTLFHTVGSGLPSSVGRIVGQVDSHEVDADHFSMLQEPHIVLIAEEIMRIRDSLASSKSPATLS